MNNLISQLSPRDLVLLCNEKIICAARDLAEFTKHGITANFIVNLAHKCEEFENQLTEQENEETLPSHLDTELREALNRICNLGKKIWATSPQKYNNYVIYRPFLGGSMIYTA
ncbi:MAG: hypothetical protein AAF694_30280 [Bacteroidota bacterium]